MSPNSDSPTQQATDGDAVKPSPFTNPIQFLAFGFGSGLSPKGPGTAGTLAAIPIYWFMADLNLLTYSAVVLVAFVVGVYLCGKASEQLGVHDHGGIVWDEFVGFWITMWAVPPDITWIIFGFVVFRVFDIAKPWPISALDKKVHGGFGIMIDDVVAGLFACGTLHLALWFT